MGRKTLAANHSDKLMAATAEAARILASDLAVISAAMQDHLRSAMATKDARDAAFWFKCAQELISAEAELGIALGKVRGERHFQHISVERVPKRTAIAPQSVATLAATAPGNPSDTMENPAEGGSGPPGEGAESTLSGKAARTGEVTTAHRSRNTA